MRCRRRRIDLILAALALVGAFAAPARANILDPNSGSYMLNGTLSITSSRGGIFLHSGTVNRANNTVSGGTVQMDSGTGWGGGRAGRILVLANTFTHNSTGISLTGGGGGTGHGSHIFQRL